MARTKKIESEEKEIELLIIKTIDKVHNSLTKNGKLILDKNKLITVFQDLDYLFNKFYNLDLKKCCKMVINDYIPLLNLIISMDNDDNRRLIYHDIIKNAYRMGARFSLEHFMIYFDWESKDKYYEDRVDILEGYVYYLNSMAFNRKIRKLIVSMPSGWGKTRSVKLYEAWRLGVDPTVTYLSISSNDRLLRQGSRSVIEIIKSKEFKEVFPKFNAPDKKIFLKETDEDWKIQGCKLATSYITATRESNSVGFRCSGSTHIDDMYGEELEAQNESLNERIYNKYQMVWTERTKKGIEPQIIATMTKWGINDILSRIINDEEEKQEFHNHPQFPYTKISEDETVVIISIPALNENDESTCPNLNTTEYLHEKRKRLNTASWLTNFMQIATPQEGLEFDYDKLITYKSFLQKEQNYCEASLDPPRKGKDYFSMPIFTPIGDKMALIDILFSKSSVHNLYNDIADKIIEHSITKLVLENNTDTSLGAMIKKTLNEKGYNANLITIYEKYNTMNKEMRINSMKDIIKQNIIFPEKDLFPSKSQMSMAMNQMTTFSFLFANKHDDMIDSVAMYCKEILLGGSVPQKAVAIRRKF